MKTIKKKLHESNERTFRIVVSNKIPLITLKKILQNVSNFFLIFVKWNVILWIKSYISLKKE